VEDDEFFRIVSLRIQPKTANGSDKPPSSAPVPQANNAATEAGVSNFTSAPAATATKAGTPAPLSSKPKNNFVGGGVRYRPGQGVRFFPVASREMIRIGSAIGSIQGQAGGDGEAFGSGTTRWDYLLFHQLQHRLSLEITGGSQFTNQRLLIGELIDERRTGGSARTDYTVLGGNSNSQLAIHVEGRRYDVSLKPKSGTTKTNLMIVETGTTANFVSLSAINPFRMRVDASMRVGKSAGQTFKGFTASFSLNRHLFDSGVSTLAISAKAQTSDAATPLFELPSLGGTESLRGFRADDFVARRIWSVQPELWFQLFGSGRWARMLRPAAFIDVGGAYGITHAAAADTKSYKDGIRAGPGVGLRFIQGPMALKLDWSYGLGHAGSSRGHGRFYVGAGTDITF
jgi:surface antigen Omp85-like protein